MNGLKSQTRGIKPIYEVRPQPIIAGVFNASNLSPQAEHTAGQVMARFARKVDKQKPRLPQMGQSIEQGKLSQHRDERMREILPGLLDGPKQFAWLRNQNPRHAEVLSVDLQAMKGRGLLHLEGRRRWALTIKGRKWLEQGS